MEFDRNGEYGVLVSVIMPSYNCGQYIEEALQSVLAQTLKDWEVLVIDDGSTDHTADILKPYMEASPRIRYISFPQSRGAAAARNEGMKQAKGRYIAFLDSDDVWLPEKLEKQIAFMQEKNMAFSCTAYGRMDYRGKPQKYIHVPPVKTDYEKCLLLSDPIGNLTAMYDRAAIGVCQVPPIRRRCDFALWLQILKRTKYCYGMQDVLAVYRTGRRESLSYDKVKLAKYQWQLYREIESHNLARSVFEMGCWAVVKGLRVGRRKRDW